MSPLSAPAGSASVARDERRRGHAAVRRRRAPRTRGGDGVRRGRAGVSRKADIEVEVIDALTSQDRFALIVNERFRRDGETIDIRRADVYRVRGDEIVEIWIFEADQYAVDALMGTAGGAPAES